MSYKKILFRRDTASNWTSVNPVLSNGEVGYETDTGKIKIGNGSSVWSSLSYFVGNLPGSSLNDIGDVVITEAANGDFLRWNGTQWINDAVNLSTDTIGNYVESLVAGTGITITNNTGEGSTPTIAFSESSACAFFSSASLQFVKDVAVDEYGRVVYIEKGAVDVVPLGSGTSGPYVETLIAGAGVTINNQGGESASPTIAIGQDVSTNASVEFNYADIYNILTSNLTVANIFGGEIGAISASATTFYGDLIGDVTGNLTGNVSGSATYATEAASLLTERTIEISGDVEGSSNFDGSANLNISVSIQPDSVDLGTHTTGNYMADVVAGNGISITHTPGEGSSASVALSADLDDLNNVSASSPSDGQFLKFISASSSWVPANIPTINNLDDVGDVSITSATNGQFLKWNGSSWINDAIDLGTDTDGNFVSDIVSGTGISITHTPGEGSSASVSLNATLDDLSNVQAPAPTNGDYLQWNSTLANWVGAGVELGTNTSGNYVSDITAGTGVTVSHTPGEGSSPTIAIGQAVGTSSSVTFARVETTGNVVVGGNLQVTGTTTTVNETNLAIEDTFIYLNDGSSITNPDLGWAGNYNDGTYQHAGLFRDATDGKFKFFDSYTPEPTDPINVSHESYSPAPVVAETFESTIPTGSAPLVVASTTEVANLHADTATTLHTARAISIDGDVSGSVSFDGGADVSITATIQPNSVALGTDTTGNYMVDVIAGTGVTISHTPGEGSSATVSIPQSIATSASPTFAIVSVNGTPTASNHLATVSYVDAQVASAAVENLDDIGDVTITSVATNDFLKWNGSAWVNDSTVVRTGTAGTVTGSMIANGTIANVDISSTAAIDRGKIADISTNQQTGAYTLVLADKNKLVEMNVASGHNLTVPLNSSVAFPVGTQITVLQVGAGQTTVVGTGGVTVNGTPGLKLRAQWSLATLIKRGTDTWVLVGDISA